jgi:nucleoside-diphosphate-sugar epimerase
VTRVLVTGGGGFIATTLIPRLVAACHDVVATTRPGSTPSSHLLGAGVTVAPCDLADPSEIHELVRRHAPQTILDLAVVRGDDLDACRRVNVGGFTALIDAAASVGAHLVHAGSSFEYGAHDRPAGTLSECRPSTALGVSKLEASRLLADAIRMRRVSGCTLRPFHVYGHHEPAARLVPRAVHAALTGSPLPLTPAGFGHDLVHVDDVSDALVAAMTQRLNITEPIDVATGVCTTNEAVVDLVEEVTGRVVDRRIGDFAARLHDRATWVGDPEDVIELLGHPPRSLHDGLAQTVAETTARAGRP